MDEVAQDLPAHEAGTQNGTLSRSPSSVRDVTVTEGMPVVTPPDSVNDASGASATSSCSSIGQQSLSAAPGNRTEAAAFKQASLSMPQLPKLKKRPSGIPTKQKGREKNRGTGEAKSPFAGLRRRLTRDLGEHFQFNALLGVLEGFMDGDRPIDVTGSTILVEGTSSPKSSGSPRSAAKLHETFEAAKFQVDKDLVNYRRDTSGILKHLAGDEHKFVKRLLEIVGRCLGMDTPMFKDSILEIIDELEGLRSQGPGPSVRVHATNLLFILSRCSRLVAMDKKTPFHPSYLSTSVSRRRRASGDGSLSPAGVAPDEDSGIHRSRTMPAKALNQVVQDLSNIAVSLSPPPSPQHAAPASRPSPHYPPSQPANLIKKPKKGRRWFRRQQEKPGPSRLRQTTRQTPYTPRPSPLQIPQDHESDTSVAGTSTTGKSFLAAVRDKLKDSFSASKRKSKNYLAETDGSQFDTSNWHAEDEAVSDSKSQQQDSLTPSLDPGYARWLESINSPGSPQESPFLAHGGQECNIERHPVQLPSGGHQSLQSTPSTIHGSPSHDSSLPDRDSLHLDVSGQDFRTITGDWISSPEDGNDSHGSAGYHGVLSPGLQRIAEIPARPYDQDAGGVLCNSPGEQAGADSETVAKRKTFLGFKLPFKAATPSPDRHSPLTESVSARGVQGSPEAVGLRPAQSANLQTPAGAHQKSDGVSDLLSPGLDLLSPPSHLRSLSSWDSSAPISNSSTPRRLENSKSVLFPSSPASPPEPIDNHPPLDYIVCRLCETEVPTDILEHHNDICPRIEQGVCGTAKLAHLRGVDEQLTKLAIALESMFYNQDSDVMQVAQLARSVAALQPDGTRLPLDRATSCADTLALLLETGVIQATTDITVDAFGRRVLKLIGHKVLELKKSLGAIEDEGCSTPGSPSVSMTIEDFEIIKLISRGAFGRVYLARKKATRDLFAIKVMRKVDLMRKNMVESVKNERNILATTNNPFVVRFYYSFQSRYNLYIVMEYVGGGDCYSLLQKFEYLEEDTARVYLAETLLALEYCHAQGIIHRDLKPDNLLISDQGHIKLTDFGLSCVGVVDRATPTGGTQSSPMAASLEHSGFSETGEAAETGIGENGPGSPVQAGGAAVSKENNRAVGTPDYLAPELLLGQGHTPAVDWWSFGAILFQFVMGYPPFNADSPQEIFQNILDLQINWPEGVDEFLTPECKDLIQQLLVREPESRLGARGATEIKMHPWFNIEPKPIEWASLAVQKATNLAPFIPEFEGEEDTSYFESKPVSQRSMAHDLLADSSIRSESSEEASGSAACGRELMRRGSRKGSILRRSGSHQSSASGTARESTRTAMDTDQVPTSLDVSRLVANRGGDPDTASPTSPAASQKTTHSDSHNSEQDYDEMRAFELEAEGRTDEEAAAWLGMSESSWDNFSFKNLENLAESNMSVHNALLRMGSISGTSRLGRNHSEPGFGDFTHINQPPMSPPDSARSTGNGVDIE